MAIFYERPDIFCYLLSKNADIHMPDSDGWVPIWTAAHYGHTEIVRMLDEAKANVNSICTDDDQTPMHSAYDFPETVRVLLGYGADINKAAKDSETPFDYAITENQPRTIRMMLDASKSKPDLTLSSTQQAIRHAVIRGYTEVVSLILEAGADVNFTDENNRSLLILAMPLNNEALVRTILEYKPNLHIKDIYENTALHFISDNTSVASVRLVVNAGGRLDIFNKFKLTPLVYAILNSNEEVVRYLLTKETVITTLSTPYDGEITTPLHDACCQSTLKIVQLLIENGSDVNFNCVGEFGTPLIAATLRTDQRETESIVKLLLQKGADPTLSGGPVGYFGYPIISASFACSADIVRLFLDRKVPLNVTDTHGRKPVHLACYNSLEVLNLLDIPDSDFAAKDLVGRVPLHYAVLSGQVDLVERVLIRSEQVGIGIEVKDNDGWTPLLWAARASRVGVWESRRTPLHNEDISFLLSKNANTNAIGRGLNRDWTVLEAAYYHNADRYVITWITLNIPRSFSICVLRSTISSSLSNSRSYKTFRR